VNTLVFGISGLPHGDGKTKFAYATAIPHLRSLGLDAMELPFVRSVNVTAKNREAILAAKAENDFHLTAHASYFINLNAAEPDKLEASLARIRQGAEALALVGGRDLVFHPGYYLGQPPEAVLQTIADNLRRLPDTGVSYRLETTGKATQFGTVAELAGLCRDIPTCKPCLDFSHIHARDNGALQTRADFGRVLRQLADILGEAALAELHIHISGIEYGPKGEKRHLPLAQSDFDYTACLAALKDHDARGCVICESPALEHDAMLLKKAWLAL